jgi:hypothetical protein
MTTVALAALLAGCATTETAGGSPGYTAAQFQQLRFLEGRWTGKAPDGSIFHDAHDFPEATAMRSRRYADATFARVTDVSVVELEGAAIISRWGQFSWRATALDADSIDFEPIDAPSSFSWRRVGDQVEVAQRWTDAKGVAQNFTLMLTRVP